MGLLHLLMEGVLGLHDARLELDQLLVLKDHLLQLLHLILVLEEAGGQGVWRKL